MKLRIRFLQLPILFDAARLTEEVSALPESAWRPHPKNFAGNHALPLITTDGDPNSDARVGAMLPTPHLLACPYLMQTLEALGATWGRARLMRLSGDAEVTPHVDTDYYWRDHMRVHVPIVTQPSVRFLCGGEQVNMAAGECWIFDTWSLHSVHNDATQSRIHLVADTVGGDSMLTLMEKGRSPGENRAGWALTPHQPTPAPASLLYERYNAPRVMTPWELRDHLGFLLSEVSPGSAGMAKISPILNRLRVSWHALWAAHGDEQPTRSRYVDLLDTARGALAAEGAAGVALKNGMPLMRCLEALIFNAGVGGETSTMDSEDRAAPPDLSSHTIRSAPVRPQAPATPSGARDPWFDRPIFVVSAPRSGSTLLFETLAQARDIYTIGGESHRLMESVPKINPALRGWDSNRLTAADADPITARMLRERFREALKRPGGAPAPEGPVRMLEKTPKNALRIAFLAEAFPEARFVFLYRDPRATLASMIEAWTSGGFQTYPQLPGWAGPNWSLLLTPGWRRLIGAPLNQIVAEQWATTCNIILDDLARLPPTRWLTLRYEALTVAPQTEIAALCRALDLAWDRRLDDRLPLSRYTLSPPDPQKWRKHSTSIDAVEALWGPTHPRALSLVKDGAMAE